MSSHTHTHIHTHTLSLSLSYQEDGQHEEAVRDLEKLLQMEPSHDNKSNLQVYTYPEYLLITFFKFLLSHYRKASIY